MVGTKGFENQNYNKNRKMVAEARANQRYIRQCFICKKHGIEAGDGYMVTAPKNNTTGFGVCADCYHDFMQSVTNNTYFTENDLHIGKNSTQYDNITFSCELESLKGNIYSAVCLVSYGFIPTFDSTVDCEWKSPIYHSLSSLGEIAGQIEIMEDRNEYGYFSVNNESCGLHTHFGLADNSFPFTTLSTGYKSLFQPLQDAVLNMSAVDREELFGRDFEYWALKCDWNYPTTHENWINIQHDNTLEFRLPRWTSANQYLRLVKILRETFKVLKVEVIDRKKNGEMFRYSEAGEKIAEAFKKAVKRYK